MQTSHVSGLLVIRFTKDALRDHPHRFFQNLHGPQVFTCWGKLCFATCSSSVPNSSGWKISPLAEEARGEESDDEEDKSTDDEREEGGVEGCGGAQGVAGIDPLGDGVPGNAAGEEGWEDATCDVATDAVACEDEQTDSLADADGTATDSARGDEGATDAVTFEDGSTDALAGDDGASDSAREDEADPDIT